MSWLHMVEHSKQSGYSPISSVLDVGVFRSMARKTTCGAKMQLSYKAEIKQSFSM